ncbi:MAG: ABC transporter ATP-binding protein [Kiloniellaceae bacterium]
MTPTAALELQQVSFSYVEGRPVLRDIGFSVASGEVVALVGRNGAGKSTLLRLLNGLLRPADGRVLIDGADISERKVSDIARVIGTVFQAPEQQIFNVSVRAELAFGPSQLPLSSEEREARVEEAMRRCGLGGCLDQHPLDLDQATRRFVAIGSVLATQPRILLLDEAQRGLDRDRRELLLRIVNQERAAGNAVILVCHDMEFVAAVADRVLGLADGRLLVDAQVGTFFADAAAVRSVSVEQPQITALGQALGLATALKPGDLVDQFSPGRGSGGAAKDT